MPWKKLKYDWRFWAWVAGAAITATWWVYDVSASTAKIPGIESTQGKLDKKTTRIDYNVYLIGKKFNLPLLEPGQDE